MLWYSMGAITMSGPGIATFDCELGGQCSVETKGPATPVTAAVALVTGDCGANAVIDDWPNMVNPVFYGMGPPNVLPVDGFTGEDLNYYYPDQGTYMHATFVFGTMTGGLVGSNFNLCWSAGGDTFGLLMSRSSHHSRF
jgi:hypothetical protein